MNKIKKNNMFLYILIFGFIALFTFVYHYTLQKNTYTTIKTTKATFNNIEVKLSITGTVKSNDERKYYRNKSKIKEINVSVGDKVKKGDLLFSYDIGEYKTALEQAKLKYDETIKNKGLLIKEREIKEEKIKKIDSEIRSLEDQIAVNTSVFDKHKSFFSRKKKVNLQNVEKEIDRLKDEIKLINENYDIKVKQYDNAINIAEAAYNKAAKKLENNNGSVISDIYGVVTSVNYDNNAIANIQNPIVSVQNLDNLKITAGLNRDEVPFVKVGQKVDIKYGDKIYKGNVLFINPVASNQTSILSITQSSEPKVNIDIGIDGCHEDMKVDFLVDADILINEKKNIITIPNECIKNDKNNRSMVYVLKNGMITEREVRTGIVSENKAEIINGLSDGDEVVINPEDDMNTKCKYKGECL